MASGEGLFSLAIPLSRAFWADFLDLSGGASGGVWDVLETVFGGVFGWSGFAANHNWTGNWCGITRCLLQCLTVAAPIFGGHCQPIPSKFSRQNFTSNAQCSATPATVELRHPRVARHLFRRKFRCDTSREWGGGKVRHQNFRGCDAPAKRYKIQEIGCDTCSATAGTRNRVQLRISPRFFTPLSFRRGWGRPLKNWGGLKSHLLIWPCKLLEGRVHDEFS